MVIPLKSLLSRTAAAGILILGIFGTFTMSPRTAAAQNFTLGEARLLAAPEPALPIAPYVPDGHISLLSNSPIGSDSTPKSAPAGLQMYWAGQTSYRTLGADIFHMGDTRPVLERGPKGAIDNGGAWLYAVARRSATELIGFYHAEDHEFTAKPDSRFIAWKSIALAVSQDNGKTWTRRGQIITSGAKKPDSPAWGGTGDFCVVWDAARKRWVCFYQETWLCMAISEDPEGKPGTWKKHYNGAFTEPGLGGHNSPIQALAGHAGGNPSVHYNTFLRRWIMVWHTWQSSSPKPKSLWISTSTNLEDWGEPKLLLAPDNDTDTLWYPTILSATSDVEASEKAWLVYARITDPKTHRRECLVREIEFQNP